MTDADILDHVLAIEGDAITTDAGGRSRYGMSERWHPDLWQPGPPTRAQARARLFERYVAPWAWLPGLGVDDRVRVQLIDFSVLQGVPAASRALQRVLDVAVDGWVGPATRAALARRMAAGGVRHLHNELLTERFVLEQADILAHWTQQQYEHGWDVRIASFYWNWETP